MEPAALSSVDTSVRWLLASLSQEMIKPTPPTSIDGVSTGLNCTRAVSAIEGKGNAHHPLSLVSFRPYGL